MQIHMCTHNPTEFWIRCRQASHAQLLTLIALLRLRAAIGFEHEYHYGQSVLSVLLRMLHSEKLRMCTLHEREAGIRLKASHLPG